MKNTRLIGERCKCSNVFSLLILIDRGLNQKKNNLNSLQSLYAVLKDADLSKTEYLVSISLRVTPVPIPNTTVKPLRADDTSGEALRESKSSPVESPEHMLRTFLMQAISQKFDNI